MTEGNPNPINEARWERLSPLAKSMIMCILHGDKAWLQDFVEGKITFVIGGRRVQSMIPAPILRPGHSLPRDL
jgi:hypothetical protein